MRKHPLIALTAFTALGASAAAGTTAGSLASVLISTRSGSHSGHVPPADASAKGSGVHGLLVWRGRHLAAAEYLSLDGRIQLPTERALPAAVAEQHKRALHSSSTRKAAGVVSQPPPPPPAPAPPPPPPAPAGGVWYELRMCESSDNYSTNTGNGYFGAYQFSLPTWDSLGYTGLPSNAPPAVQDQAAEQLQARSGWDQWPQCAAALGLT
jgi:hypothetical protein